MENRFIKENESKLKALLGILSMAFLVYSGSVLLKKVRFDFTEENLFTLSEGTKKILKKIDSPIRLKLYYSKTAANKGTEGIRSFNNYFEYVNVMLNQFSEHSQNNIKLEVIDPRPDTPEEEDAILYGLRRFNLTESERYFFGLVAESEGGKDDVIDFFDPNQKDRLEYDLVKLIHKITNSEKPQIGILSPLDIVKEELSPYMAQIMRMQGKSVEGSWGIAKLAKDLFELRIIDKEKPDFSLLKAVVVIHPVGFSEKVRYELDQFLMRGGSLVVFTDPHFSQASSMAPGLSMASPDKRFTEILEKYGFKFSPSTFVGDKYLTRVGQYSPNMPPTRLLPIIDCDGRCITDVQDPISSGLKSATFIYPGPVEFSKDNFEVTSLVKTTSKGNTYVARGYQLNNPPSLWQSFNEGDEAKSLALKVVGQFESAYEKPPKFDNAKKNEKATNHLSKAKEKSAIILFNDVDFLTDRYAFQKTFLGMAVTNSNSTLFLNAIEALSGDIDLLSVRSKGRIKRTFDVIEQIEFEAEKNTSEKIKEINQSIAKFQLELNKIGQKAGATNVALIQNEGLKKRQELNKKIALLKKQLRSVKREGREKIESLGKFFQVINTMLVPFIVVIIGIFYLQKRKNLTITKKQAHMPKYSRQNTISQKEART